MPVAWLFTGEVAWLFAGEEKGVEAGVEVGVDIFFEVFCFLFFLFLGLKFFEVFLKESKKARKARRKEGKKKARRKQEESKKKARSINKSIFSFLTKSCQVYIQHFNVWVRFSLYLNIDNGFILRYFSIFT
jgi:hypothetical protein